jgi:O-antigen ligase
VKGGFELRRVSAANSPKDSGILFTLFCIWDFVLIGRPQDFFGFLSPFRPALLLALMITAVFVLRYSHLLQEKPLDNPQAKIFIYLFLLMIVGIPFAYHRRFAFMFVFTVYLSNVLFLFFFVLSVNSTEKLRTILYISCVATFIYGLFSVLRGVVLGGRLAVGSMFDPNDLSYFLVSFLPYNMLFISSDVPVLKRILCAVNIPLLMLVILFTASRGGFVALGVVSLILISRRSMTVRFRHKVIFISICAMAIVYLGSSIDYARFKTLLNINNDYNLTDEFGRKEIWELGLKLMLTHPMTGVGANCFDMAIGEARKQAGQIPKWQTAHNSWIQVGTETGVFGFILFGLLAWRALKIFGRSARSAKSDELRKLGEMAFIGFTGNFIAAMFLSQGYSIFWTWYIALSIVMYRMMAAEDNEPDLDREALNAK